nr:adenosylcobinamide-phosphate synthase CbiB [Tritonibacter litoralis]
MLLIPALLLDALLGEPKWLWSRCPHPAVLMGRLVGWCDAHLNHGSHRRLKGVLTVGLLLLIGAGLGYGASHLGPVVSVVIAAILLAQRSLVDHVNAVADGLDRDLSAGRYAVSMIVSRDTRNMDQSQVARSAIESGAENFSDGVIAPAFWFLVAGLPGIIIYKMVNTADSMIGYRTAHYLQFGWAAARLDDLLNLVPARLTSLLIAATGGRVLDLLDIRRDARLHRSPNAGWPEAAMARVLGCALAGPRSYDGKMQVFPWVHDAGRKTLTPQDIRKTSAILWRVWATFLTVSVALALLF